MSSKWNEDRVVAEGPNGAAATANPLATQAAIDVLKAGGNAVDAAIAASFVLGVVEPFMSGIGGGAFIMFHDGATGKVSALNARGVAPAAATEDMYVTNGVVDYEATSIGHRSVLVPGLVAGIDWLHSQKGTRPMEELVEAGAKVAEDGFVVSSFFAGWVRQSPLAQTTLARNAEGSKLYLSGGELPAAGSTLRNPDLAATYRHLARKGLGDFYRGELAARIVAEMKAGGGLIDEADLAEYRPLVQEPLRGTYRDYEIISLAPPSSGGILLIQVLNALERMELSESERYSPRTIHLLAELLKRAYAGRAHYVGDPRFVDVPVAGLTSKEYAQALLETVDMERASKRVERLDPAPYSGHQHTTHLSVVDRDGNVVGITQTIGSAFGSGVVVPGTGVLLNHLMSDFSPMVGANTAHGWGTYTSRANAIAPGKTPTSSNTPVIVLRDGKPVLCVGAAGGSRIPSTVLQVVINALDFGMDVQSAISAPRIHDQGEGLELEEPLFSSIGGQIAALGHDVKLGDLYGGGIGTHAHGVAIDQARGVYAGGAELRGDGQSLAF